MLCSSDRGFGRLSGQGNSGVVVAASEKLARQKMLRAKGMCADSEQALGTRRSERADGPKASRSISRMLSRYTRVPQMTC